MLKKKYVAKYWEGTDLFEARVKEFPVEIFQAETFLNLEEWVRECIAEHLDCGLNDFDLEFVKAEKAVS